MAWCGRNFQTWTSPLANKPKDDGENDAIPAQDRQPVALQIGDEPFDGQPCGDGGGDDSCQQGDRAVGFPHQLRAAEPDVPARHGE